MTASKRNLLAELMEGVDALAAAREGKDVLLHTEVSKPPVVGVEPSSSPAEQPADVDAVDSQLPRTNP